MGATLFDKIWSEHRIAADEGCKTLLYIDRVVADDVRAPQVLKNLERRALPPRGRVARDGQRDCAAIPDAGRRQMTIRK
jgi:homoaconitase/3-isopropylmalate dehydratase large subunit